VLEHEVARGTVDLLSNTEAHYLTGALPADRPEIFTDITDTLQSGIQHLKNADNQLGTVDKITGKFIPNKAKEIIEDTAAYTKSVEQLRNKYNGQIPGLGDKVAEVTETLRTKFGEMAAIEHKAGVLDHTIRGYVHQMYQPALLDDVADSPLKKKIIDLFGHGDTADFRMERTMRTIKEAELRGLKPEKDVRKILQSRLYWHHRVMAEKDFAERMAYNLALPKEVHDQLQRLAVSDAKGIQEQAAGVLSKYGVKNPLDLLITESGGAATTKYGLVDGNVYDRWLKEGLSDNPEYRRIALEEATKSAPLLAKRLAGEAIPDEALLAERKSLQDRADVFKASNERLMGRDGEGPLTRAGATTVNDATKRRFNKMFDKEDEKHILKFYDNVLPQTFVEAVEESAKGFDTLTAIERQLAAAGVKDPAHDPIRRMLGVYKGHVGLLKKGATLFWPGYWIRNIMGAPFQMAHQTAQLGEAFSMPQMYKVLQVIREKSDLATATGILTGKQLKAEMAQFGITGSHANQIDLMQSYADQLASIINTSDSLRSIPALRRYLEKPAGPIKRTLGKIESAFTGKSGVTDWAWEKLPTFGDRLEAFGRQHLYITRRMRGDDPQSAANIVRRMMVDYGHGKTAFERNFLNNMFFFYSFSRGNLPTLFTSLMERPGILSNSFVAGQNIAEIARASTNIEEADTDLGERLKSIRQREGLSFVVGKNKQTGLPVVVSSVGLPVEDLGRFSALYLPTGSTWSDLISSVGKSASRSMQLAVSQMNPWITTAYKVATEKDPFYNKPITDKKLRQIAGFERDMTDLSRYTLDKIPGDAMKKIDKALFGLLGAKDNGDGTYLVNPYVFMLLTNVVPGASRFINTRNALSKPGQAGETKLLRGVTGVNVQDQDLETSAVFDRKAQLEDFLRERDIPTSFKGYRDYRRTQEKE
jgi:hypothetical protein